MMILPFPSIMTAFYKMLTEILQSFEECFIPRPSLLRESCIFHSSDRSSLMAHKSGILIFKIYQLLSVCNEEQLSTSLVTRSILQIINLTLLHTEYWSYLITCSLLIAFKSDNPCTFHFFCPCAKCKLTCTNFVYVPKLG